MEVKYWYCLGLYLSNDFCEHTCKKRDNCRYYDVDVYAHNKHIWHEMDFLVCHEPCQYYLPKREEVNVELREDEDPFAPLMQHDMK